MKLINNIILKAFAGLTLTAVGIYSVLLCYIYYTDKLDVKIVKNVKSVYARYKEPHDILLIKDGIYSLKKRIDLIQNAKESIELEFFIYELDLSSKLVTYELIQAASRGVKVKILVDFSVAVFKLGPEYTSYLKEQGVKVRYYNTVSNTNFISVQHRNHRKLLIVDGNKVITGGRNIGNEYFDLDAKYNFLDYDILVQGKIVKDIRQSFYGYWESDYSTIPKSPDTEMEIGFFNETKQFKGIYSYFEKNKQLFEKEDQNIFQCNDIAYTTDFPGVLVSNRQVYKRIEEIVAETESEIYVESPYVVLRKDGIHLIKSVIDKGAKFSILTNSLHSTDAYYTSSALGLKLSQLEGLGINLYLYKGHRSLSSFPSMYKTKSLWGIHSKRSVIDKKHVMVGTYNIDPRSANLNSEMIIICRNNPRLAKVVLGNLNERLKNTTKLKKDNYEFGDLTKNATLSNKFKFYLSMPIVFFLDFLL